MWTRALPFVLLLPACLRGVGDPSDFRPDDDDDDTVETDSGGADTDARDTAVDLPDLTLAEAWPRLFTDFEQGCDRLARIVEVIDADGLAARPLDGDVEDRAFALDPLPLAGLDVPTPAGAEPDEQTGVAVLGRGDHDLATSVAVALQANQVCIAPESEVFHARTWAEGGAACLQDGTCRVARSVAEVFVDLVFAKVWYDLHADFRRCALHDGRTFLVSRAWTEEAFVAQNANQSIAQYLRAELWLEDGDATRRAVAVWPEIRIGLGPDAMRALLRDSLDDGIDNADLFADDPDADWCRDDRDATRDDFPARP